MLCLRLAVICVFVFFIVVDVLNAERIRFDGYRLYQVFPKKLQDLDFLVRLQASSDSLKFLTEIARVDKPISILVAPHKRPEFLGILEDNKIGFELLNKDFQQSLDAEAAEFKTRSSVYDWTGYHTLNETYDWLRSLQQQYPNNVEIVVAGRSYEGRDILGVKVSFKSGNKGIFIEGGIHAREWISAATVTYLLNEILSSKDSVVRTMAQKFDWYVFPHVNPDGFVYTHTTNRLWRKTRTPGTVCYGADPNRNWDYHWMEVGASSDECSDLYAGKAPFSEIETKTLSEYITSLKGKIQTYLSFHSYGQMMLFPYSYTDFPAPNNDDLQQIGDAAAAALVRRYGTAYEVGNSYITIYPVAGSSDDWVYGVLDILLSYTIELRPSPNGVSGFILPSAQIIPTGQETLDALMAFNAEAEKLGYYK